MAGCAGALVRRGTLTSFPGPRADQVLAHVEGRCGGVRACSYCRAGYEARHYDESIIHQLAESIHRIHEAGAGHAQHGSQEGGMTFTRDVVHRT